MDDGVEAEGLMVTSPRPSVVPDRVWVPALGALVLALAFVGALLVRAEGDPSILVHAGPPWTSTDGAHGSLTVQKADQAFDGQFFYRLGVAPWSEAPREAGVQMDLPALRNSRWGYGALAFVFSGGDPDLVPWSLIGLNVVAAATVAAVGGMLVRDVGKHAAWGLLFVLWPGFAYSLSLDTSELVASAFALGGLVLLRRRWFPVAGLLFGLAVITRDTTTVIPFGVLAAGAVLMAERVRARSTGRRTGAVTGAGTSDAGTSGGTDGEERATDDRDEARAQPPIPTALAFASAEDAPAGAVGVKRMTLRVGLFVAGWTAVVDFFVWQVVQGIRFGELPVRSSGDNNLTGPLVGLVKQLGKVLPPSGSDEAFRLLAMSFLIGLVALAAAVWRRSAAPLAERVAWIAAVGTVALLNAYLWSGATAFLRASTEAGLLSILVILGTRRDRLISLMGVVLAGMWALTAIGQLTKIA